MKTLLTFIAIAFLATIPVDAKTFKLPNGDFAIASIDMPDSWKPKEVENGIWGQSADTAVYMSVVAVGSEKGMNAEIDDTFEMLKTHNVTIDDSTKKENKFKVGSLDATELLFQGKDEDGPCAVSICFVPIKDKMIIFTYWVTTAKEKEHLKEVGTIVNSLAKKKFEEKGIMVSPEGAIAAPGFLQALAEVDPRVTRVHDTSGRFPLRRCAWLRWWLRRAPWRCGR